MPMHDWTRVEAGIFHAFHHNWISSISNALNGGLLPPQYYALPEQHAAGFGPDVLALQTSNANDQEGSTTSTPAATALLAQPTLAPTAETDMEFHRRKQNHIVVRHVSGDRVIAMIEIVSPGNKSTRHAFRNFVEKAAELLERGVHLLLLDPLPPGPRDPAGLHAAVWEEIAGEVVAREANKPLTLASYETGLSVRAYVRNLAPGDVLPTMPLFLESQACVNIALESTYAAAFAAMPGRWRSVLEG